jgi:hypothetical protein
VYTQNRSCKLLLAPSTAAGAVSLIHEMEIK